MTIEPQDDLTDFYDSFWIEVKRISEERGLTKKRVLSMKVDEDWNLTFNGLLRTVNGLAPFNVAILWRALPWGVVGPSGGTVADVSLATHEALLEALRGCEKGER